MEVVLFQNGFNRGADLFRNGNRIDRIPANTRRDDNSYILVDRDGEAILQIDKDGKWTDSESYGPAIGLEVQEDCPSCGGRGCVYCGD